MKTNIQCGACTKQLSVEHYKECRNVQCKCEHYRKQHNRYEGSCRRFCKCRRFDAVLKFDEFWGWSKAVKPEILYTRQGLKTGVRL